MRNSIKKAIKLIISKQNKKPVIFNDMNEMMGSIKVDEEFNLEDIDSMVYDGEEITEVEELKE